MARVIYREPPEPRKRRLAERRARSLMRGAGTLVDLGGAGARTYIPAHAYTALYRDAKAIGRDFYRVLDEARGDTKRARRIQ